ncbi:MAG: Chemotaxis protein CheY [Myxococcota bacterium]|nr:Chemotaxis protein CheY [Myxococcota bacterium]
MAKRILIVDDAQFMREMIRDILEGDGYEICGEAENGEQAIEMWQKLKPHLTTMDIVMPKMSGIEATRRIHELDGDSKIVVCSALGQESMVIEAIESGACEFIVKPFSGPELLKVVRSIIGPSQEG